MREKRYASMEKWLSRNTWDARERASRYREHTLGEGWQQPYDEIVYDAVTHQEAKERKFKNVPGFERKTAPSSVKVDDVGNINENWTITIDVPYTDRSFRSKKNAWVRATPMISVIKCAPAKGIMEVTFANNGAVVGYDHVPREVMAELRYAAESGRSVGVKFWDLVRNRRPYGGRGGNSGGKYPYWYVRKGQDAIYQNRAAALSGDDKRRLERRVDQVLNDGAPEWLSREQRKKFFGELDDAWGRQDWTMMLQIFNAGKAAGVYPSQKAEAQFHGGTGRVYRDE
jgi:hypothetical protein